MLLRRSAVASRGKGADESDLTAKRFGGVALSEEPVEDDQHAAEAGIQVFDVGGVMDPVRGRRIQDIFQPAEPRSLENLERIFESTIRLLDTEGLKGLSTSRITSG